MDRGFATIVNRSKLRRCIVVFAIVCLSALSFASSYSSVRQFSDIATVTTSAQRQQNVNLQIPPPKSPTKSPTKSLPKQPPDNDKPIRSHAKASNRAIGRKNYTDCVDTSRHPQTRVDSFPDQSNRATIYKWPNGTDLSIDDFVNSSISASRTSIIQAVCQFREDRLSSHFPHAMQQVYGCWAYWQHVKEVAIQYRNTPSGRGINGVKPILVMESNKRKLLEENQFMRGMLQSLEQPPFRVEIVPVSNENPNAVTVLSPGGYYTTHTASLRRGILSQLHHARADRKDLCCCPSVAILNRKEESGRSIINADEIIEETHSVVHWQKQGIPVVYFEKSVSFQEQLKFFASTDILLSPHGAQLTGLVGMPQNGCSQILELFPEGIILPSFFGSLAVHSNISYSYMAGMSQATNVRQRMRARRQKMCPTVSVLTTLVRLMINDWQSCCRRQTV